MKKETCRKPSESDMKFLETISPEELITVEEEVELVQQIQRAEGDVNAAKDKLMRANRRFVRSVAQRYVSAKSSLDELMAEGSKGLAEAVDTFDGTKGYKFSTYAVWWIRKCIQEYVGRSGVPSEN